MKALHHFEAAKFQALSPIAQIKALIRMISALENLHADPIAQATLLEHIHLCSTWTDSELPIPLSKFLAVCPPGSDRREIALSAAACMMELGDERRDADILIREGDGPRPVDNAAYSRAQSTIVILSDLRSAFNVGSIFRGADCLGISQLWLCGITATPESPALQKTAMGTDTHVKWRCFANTNEALDLAEQEGYRIAALETSMDAVSVFTWTPRFPLALVLGNEALGLSREVLARCEYALELPVMGWKNSLNVGVAFTAAAYQIIHGSPAQSPPPTENTIGDTSHGTS